MQEDQQTRILRAFQLVLRPIVKILLRYGIGYNQFAETVKTAFVDVASSDFGIRGRPTNISRVAVMSGLTRKEVKRLRTKIDDGDQTTQVKSTPITEILHRWHGEEEFLDSSGRPAALPFLGDRGSFSSLVKKFGGDVPPGAMRTELKRVGSIEEDVNGQLCMKQRSYWPTEQIDALDASLVHCVYPLLSTISNNTNPKSIDDPLPQYAAHSLNIRKSDLSRLRRMCKDRLSSMAENIDDMFIAYETLQDDPTDDRFDKPVMVGLYYFEERDHRAKYDW